MSPRPRDARDRRLRRVAAARLVLTADVSIVPSLVEQLEQRHKIHRADARLVARRRIGELDVRGARQQLAHGRFEFCSVDGRVRLPAGIGDEAATGHRQVVKIELQLAVWLINAIEHAQRRRRVGNEVCANAQEGHTVRCNKYTHRHNRARTAWKVDWIERFDEKRNLRIGSYTTRPF